MKKETLEEAAERLTYDSTEENKGFPSMKRFIEGAKWQAERMYSEEEALELLLNKLHLHRVAYSGEENGRSLLTKEQVLEIKQKYIPYKYSAKKLSKEYNVSESCITHILNNTSWKEISTK